MPLLGSSLPLLLALAPDAATSQPANDVRAPGSEQAPEAQPAATEQAANSEVLEVQPVAPPQPTAPMTAPVPPAASPPSAASPPVAVPPPAAVVETVKGTEDPSGADQGPHPIEAKIPVGKSTLVITPYGMVIANAIYNTGTPFPSSEAPVGAAAGSLVGRGLISDGGFLITARQSRFGLMASMQLNEKIDVNGKIEVDFWGLHEKAGPAAILQSAPRLRLAYLDIGGKRLRFVAGQDYSVITPRLPTSIGHTVIPAHALSGAVWQRIPQLTGVYRQPLDAPAAFGKASFVVKLSLTRAFSADASGDIHRFDPVSGQPGVAGRLPWGQGRAAFESDLLAVGVAGHGGRETFIVTSRDGSQRRHSVETWMVGGDFKLSPKWFWVMGQGYYGANLNGLFSRQGVRQTLWSVGAGDPLDGQLQDVDALPAFGGWAEVGVEPGTKKIQLFASAGVDATQRSAAANGASWLNAGVLAGVLYAPFPNFDMSLEYYRNMSYFRSDLPDPPAAQVSGFNDNVSANFRFKF